MSVQKVAAVSGGRTSGKMLDLLLNQIANYRGEFLTLFCNTGKERNETLDFVHEMETRWAVPIIWLEYTRVPASSVDPDIFPTEKRRQNHRKLIDAGEECHWFKVVNYELARRNGSEITPFDELLNWSKTLPNVRTRQCSVQLKVRTMERFLFSQGIHQWSDHIGIRADESHRTIQILGNAPSYTLPKFPLVEAGIMETDVLKFWAENDFDLKLKSYEGNCDLCFLKSKAKRLRLASERPDSVLWWKSWEEVFESKTSGDGCRFRLGESYAELLEKSKFLHPEFQFSSNDAQDIPCSCAERGFDDQE